MFKKYITFYLICAISLVFNLSVASQTQNKITSEIPVNSEKEIPAKPEINVNKVFAKEFAGRNFEIEKAKVDFKKIEKDQYKQPQKKGKTSTKTKLIWIAVIAGIAVGVTLLAIYGKVPKCDEAACDPVIDPDCICER